MRVCSLHQYFWKRSFPQAVSPKLETIFTAITTHAFLQSIIGVNVQKHDPYLFVSQAVLPTLQNISTAVITHAFLQFLERFANAAVCGRQRDPLDALARKEAWLHGKKDECAPGL